MCFLMAIVLKRRGQNPREALGPNIVIVTLSGSIFLNLNTLYGCKITIVVLSEGEDLQIVYPFGSIFVEKDTRLGSKNGENDTLSNGTYPVPKILKCPPGANIIRNSYDMEGKVSFMFSL